MNTSTLRKAVVSWLIGITIVIAALYVSIAYAARVAEQPVERDSFQRFSFFSATTTNATSTTDGSGGFVIAGAKKVNFYFTHGGTATTSTGTNVFSVEVTPDGTNWYDFNKLVQNTSTSTADITTLTYVTVGAATTTTLVGMDLANDAFHAVRCISTETGTEGQQGESTCVATAEF